MNKFSPNMLKTYKLCRKKYYYKYVLNISAPQKQSPFEKGKKIHALANYYLKGDDISKLEKTLTPDETAVWNLLKDNNYLRMQYLHSEYDLACKINNFWVGGRLDALVKDNEKYYILDYKTGAIPTDPQNDYQTMIYLLAANDFYQCNENIAFVYIDLKNNKDHLIEFSKELKEQYTKEITKICKEITGTNNFVKNENSCKFCEYSKLC